MSLRAARQHLLGWSFTAVMATLMMTTTLLSFGALAYPVGRPLLRIWGRGMLAILGVRLVLRGQQHVRGRASRIIPLRTLNRG